MSRHVSNALGSAGRNVYHHHRVSDYEIDAEIAMNRHLLVYVTPSPFAPEKTKVKKLVPKSNVNNNNNNGKTTGHSHNTTSMIIPGNDSSYYNSNSNNNNNNYSNSSHDDELVEVEVEVEYETIDEHFSRFHSFLEARFGLKDKGFKLVEAVAPACPIFIRRQKVSMFPTLVLFDAGKMVGKVEGMSSSVPRSYGKHNKDGRVKIRRKKQTHGISDINNNVGDVGNVGADFGNGDEYEYEYEDAGDGAAGVSGPDGGFGGGMQFADQAYAMRSAWDGDGDAASDVGDDAKVGGKMLGSLFDSRIRQLAMPFDAQLKQANLLNFVIAVLGIIVAIVILEIGHSGMLEKDHWVLNVLRASCSGLTFILIARLYLYRLILLRIDQYRWNLVQRRSLIGVNGLLFLLEVLVVIWHPPPFAVSTSESVQVQVIAGTDSINIDEVEERFDERIATMMLMRLYLVFRVIRDHSSVYQKRKEIVTASTETLAKESVSANDFNWFFVIKTLFHFSNVTFVLVLLVVGPLLFAYCIYVSERDFQPEFALYKNALWYTIITMLTVGYGDIATASIWGRTFSILSGFFGIIITALVITVVSEKLTMSNREKYSATIAKLRHIQREERGVAATYIQFMWKRHIEIKTHIAKLAADSENGSQSGPTRGVASMELEPIPPSGHRRSRDHSAVSAEQQRRDDQRFNAQQKIEAETHVEGNAHLARKVAIMKRLKSLRRDRVALSNESEYVEPIISRLDEIQDRVETMAGILVRRVADGGPNATHDVSMHRIRLSQQHEALKQVSMESINTTPGGKPRRMLSKRSKTASNVDLLEMQQLQHEQQQQYQQQQQQFASNHQLQPNHNPVPKLLNANHAGESNGNFSQRSGSGSLNASPSPLGSFPRFDSDTELIERILKEDGPRSIPGGGGSGATGVISDPALPLATAWSTVVARLGLTWEITLKPGAVQLSGYVRPASGNPAQCMPLGMQITAALSKSKGFWTIGVDSEQRAVTIKGTGRWGKGISEGDISDLEAAMKLAFEF